MVSNSEFDDIINTSFHFLLLSFLQSYLFLMCWAFGWIKSYSDSSAIHACQGIIMGYGFNMRESQNLVWTLFFGFLQKNFIPKTWLLKPYMFRWWSLFIRSGLERSLFIRFWLWRLFPSDYSCNGGYPSDCDFACWCQ